MTMSALNMPMSPDTIYTHVVFCLPRVTNHQLGVTFSAISFRFTLLSKNASATPFFSHSCKNKGLKPLSFHTLSKKWWGYPPPTSNLKPTIRSGWSSRASGASRGTFPPTSNLRSSILAVAEPPRIEQTINPPTAQRQPCNAG